MRKRVVNAVHSEFALDVFIATAAACAFGVATLSHKAVNYTVKGKTVIKNAERLRLKESDRLKETVLRLKSFGINAEETSDGMIIEGGKPKAAEITSANDHRIVMAFSILAANADGESTIDGYEAINKSYPDFFEDYKALGGNAKCHQA